MEGSHTESVVFKEIRGSHKKLLKESHISAMLGQYGEQVFLIQTLV